MLPSHIRRPWPGGLEVVLLPRAYLALLYQFLGLPLAIAGFSWWATGLGLSLGLTVIGVGLLLGFAHLVSVRGLAFVQGRIAWGLSGVPDLDLPLVPEGAGFWDRLRALLVDPTTWCSQLYVILRLPLGVAGFALVVSLLALSGGLILAAGLHWATAGLGPDGLAHLQVMGQPFTVDPGDLQWPAVLATMPRFGRLTAVVLGLGGMVGTLHLALGLAWLDGRMARALLGRDC